MGIKKILKSFILCFTVMFVLLSSSVGVFYLGYLITSLISSNKVLCIYGGLLIMVITILSVGFAIEENKKLEGLALEGRVSDEI